MVVPGIIIITIFIRVIAIGNIVIIIGRTIFKSAIELLFLYNFYIVILTDTLLYKNVNRIKFLIYFSFLNNIPEIILKFNNLFKSTDDFK